MEDIDLFTPCSLCAHIATLSFGVVFSMTKPLVQNSRLLELAWGAGT